MSEPSIASNVSELQKLFKEQSAYNDELSELYVKWEELGE